MKSSNKYFYVLAYIMFGSLISSCGDNKSQLNSMVAAADSTAFEKEDSLTTEISNLKEDTLGLEVPFLEDWWISDEEIKRYFPNVIDTIAERRQIVATRFREKPWPTIQLSTIRNTGTFEQIFLCTHDSTLQLIDSYYVGKARDMDGTSEGIEYKLLDKRNLYFEHIVWIDNFDTIDSLPPKRYTLHITEKGEIVKR
jgi:hypothetical protein